MSKFDRIVERTKSVVETVGLIVLFVLCIGLAAGFCWFMWELIVTFRCIAAVM